MSDICFPRHSKQLTLSTKNTYGYVHIPPLEPSTSTVLFLHGFPSSCYDWRHQIKFFSNQGYGVLAPDLLGYGGTSKPASVLEYRTKRMAGEMREILKHEKLGKVHAVSHDTGSILLSRMADYHPELLLSCTFLAVPYSKPADHFDLEAINAMTKNIMGKEKFGYLNFFIEENAGQLIDEHSDSFFTVFYPEDPAIWNDHVGPTGALKAWLRSDHQAELASFITEEERTIHQKIMEGHHKSALNWYRMLVSNLNEEDEREACLSGKLSLPVLILNPAPGSSLGPNIEEAMRAVAENLTFHEVHTHGHWLQLEARNEVNAALKKFIQACDVALSKS